MADKLRVSSMKGGGQWWKSITWAGKAFANSGFEVETTRRFSDKRYSAKCRNEKCRGPLMAFMRYCPWCRVKTKRPWTLPGSATRCSHCRWGVDTNFWHYCPWCTKALES